MSTFGGKLEEIPYISVDRFDGDNWKSSAFFLTHCHSDHMDGIYNYFHRKEFVSRLQSRANVFIYTSLQSKAILDSWKPELKDYVKDLDMSGKNFINIPDTDITLTVSLLPAGHCPGSVMFLFETDKKILYTGDIRLRVNELKKFKNLYDETKTLKRIDHIYLDTTFFYKSFLTFPLRKKSIEEVCKIINEWISKSPKHLIFILSSGHYGSEALFIEIFKNCRLPIHVHKDKYDVYKHFPEMDNVFTTDPKKTQIHHSCTGYDQFCRNSDSPLIKKIKASAMTWKSDTYENGIVKLERGVVKICYSSHSSYMELVDILKFLKPSQITPCVVRKEVSEKEELNRLINEVLNEIQSDIKKADSDDDKFDVIIDWTRKNNDNSVIKNNSDSESSSTYSFLDSPEMKKKKIIE